MNLASICVVVQKDLFIQAWGLQQGQALSHLIFFNNLVKVSAFSLEGGKRLSDCREYNNCQTMCAIIGLIDLECKLIRRGGLKWPHEGWTNGVPPSKWDPTPSVAAKCAVKSSWPYCSGKSLNWKLLWAGQLFWGTVSCACCILVFSPPQTAAGNGRLSCTALCLTSGSALMFLTVLKFH